MTIIEKIKEFFEECPLLEKGRVNVNYLGTEQADYSLEAVPAQPVVRRYVDGPELRQFVFVFASREFCDEDMSQNMETARFYEELAEWIEERNGSGKLPLLDGGLEAMRLEVTAGGYLFSARSGTARYQLQCRLIYRKEG